MKVLEYADIVKLHVDKFGVEPVITGIKFGSQDDVEELILEAITIGVPYVEQKVPDGVLT
mgnify:CR=1 FL=1